MALPGCPGSTAFKQPTPEIIECPSCGEEMEMWSDEVVSKCAHCGKTVSRVSNLSCLEWCKYGKQCVGDDVYNKYMQNRTVGIRELLLKEIGQLFSGDVRSIQKIRDVLQFAEFIMEKEECEPHIVIPAVILHSLELSKAEELLLKAGLSRDDIADIMDIVARHESPGENENLNFRTVCDACSLSSLRGMDAEKKAAELRELISGMFLTDTGRDLANDLCHVK